MLKETTINLASNLRKLMILMAVTGLVLASMSTIFSGRAHAAQMGSRKVTISDSKISATGVNYTFTFTTATSAAIQGVRLQFCTTPLGACTTVAGSTVATADATAATQTWTNAGDLTDNGSTDQGDCTENTNPAQEICLDRVVATAETPGAKVFTLNTVTNPSSQTTTYIRIATYSDTAYATKVDEGIVASATARQLTVNGRVQERLEFCVAAIDDASALPANCGAMASTTTIDMGVIDNSSIAQAPVNVTSTNGSNDFYGVAMINTNASSGAVLGYYPEAAGSGTNELRAFRVAGVTCNASGTDLTDQCFQSATPSNTADTFTAGTERFGMVVPCIDTTQGTTANMSGVTAYNGTDASTTSGVNCQNEANTKFAWNNSGTAATIASSSNVVDNEIVKLRFGATASATTPTGIYTVKTTYIATPTF